MTMGRSVVVSAACWADAMPAVDESAISRRESIAAALRAVVGEAHVIVSEDERRAYETDALTAYRAVPLAVVLPGSTEEVAEVLIAGSAYQTMSTDVPLRGGEDEAALGDTLGAPDSSLENVDGHVDLEPALAHLPERERAILVLRFYGGLTQTQIAQRMGISQMHVSRLLAKTLSALREELVEEE